MVFMQLFRHPVRFLLILLILPLCSALPASAGISARFSTAEGAASAIRAQASSPVIIMDSLLFSCGDISMTHSSTQTITVDNSVRCSNGVQHVDNSYWRAFTLPDFGILSNLTLCEIQVGIEEATSPGGTQPLSVRLYTSSQTFPTGYPGSLTQIGSTDNFTVPDQSGTIFSIPVNGLAPADSELVVEIFTPDGTAAGRSFTIGSNADNQTGPSYLSAADCGIPTPTTTADIGFPTCISS